MAIFDYYGEMQLKVGDVCMAEYQLFDAVPIPDGVYVAWEGIIVVIHGQWVAQFEYLTDKWGGSVRPEKILAEP